MSQNRLYKEYDLKKILPLEDRAAAIHVLNDGRALVFVSGFVSGQFGKHKLEPENSHCVSFSAKGWSEEALITRATDLLEAVIGGQVALGHGDGTIHQFL
ncbi:MAG: hypothetical protein COU83_01270 [Candidatus Portnoybacteria bacterium CG10_big_fil_rev_8_21_14_0_10_40_22]|uniref:Uncharacterized protein n=1 Tax=Candidatus Portnoybacteria bacterium CG10_big_fil_rev_8_21_14_0_10_40_22 TaxID=1974814 RepID=A0A2M8KG75_9BACT|nr:MAG: hypothetical protein COU83_01270 [Candidatus Portnoybacteria bacterium CG10_big_fil_rev_8_21_14_0_10_40_22]